MLEETQTVEQQQDPANVDAPDAVAEDKTKDQKVPYARFEEVNKRAKAAEQELDDLREKIIQFEDRDKSELERAKDRASRAEQQLNQLGDKVTAMEKGAWVRSAAAELNFHDPEDAVAALNLGQLEDERDAKRQVEKLAKRKEHLVRSEKNKDRPSIGRLFGPEGQGQGQPGQQGQGFQMSPAQLAVQQNAEEAQHFAEGLRDQLNRFRENWHDGGKVV